MDDGRVEFKVKYNICRRNADAGVDHWLEGCEIVTALSEYHAQNIFRKVYPDHVIKDIERLT